MADDKRSRETQARDADTRQREQDIAVARDRAEELEPPVDAGEFDELESDLEAVEFPATGAALVGAIGDRQLHADDESYTLEELLPQTEAATFDSPSAVWTRVRRSTVAAAMKRVEDATGTLQNTTLRGSQRTAYEKTFRELEAIDADDDDDGVEAVADWIVEQIHERKTIPGSRGVRRQAATFCRANGYEVRTDEWLGI